MAVDRCSSARSEAPRGRVFNLQRFSTQDGPGIRSTVFLKGCPLSCPWCHNPEGLSGAPEILVHDQLCLGCGSCVEACPLKGASPGQVPPAECRVCGACVEACPSEARRLVGESWSVEDLVEWVLRDRLFFDQSGGGVSFSGGEPLSQPAFLLSCLEALGQERVHRVVDTSGCGSPQIMRAVAESADLVLFDLKILDPERHLKQLGVPLAPILHNLELAVGVGVEIWLRMPVVPGYTDDVENLAAVAELAASLPTIRRLCLLPYHGTGAAKHRRIRGVYGLPLVTAPGDERMAELAAVLSAVGLEVSIGG